MNTTTTAHPVSPEELMAHLDAELPADRVSLVASHLAECSECCSLSAQLQESSLALHKWRIDDPNDSLNENLLRAADPRTAAGAGQLYRLQLFFSRPLPWAIACLAVVALIFAQFSGRQLGMERQSSTLTFNKARATPIVSAPLPSSPSAGPSAGGGRGMNQDAALSLEAEGKSPYMSSLPASAAPPPPPPAQGGRASKEHEEAAPMIARTADLRIVVPKFESARSSLDAILLRYRAYAAALQVSTTEGSPRAITASLRVPAAQLGSAIADLKALGRVESESQSGEEVTQQHADLLARLKNSRETEIRLQDILRTRTGKVKDVLEVEEEISRVRGEIEQMEAERKTLEHRVDFATLNLTLAEEFKAQLSSPAPSLGTQWRNSIVTGFRNAFDSLFAVILLLSEVAPVLLLWAALLLPVGWLLWRRFRAVQAAIS